MVRTCIVAALLTGTLDTLADVPLDDMTLSQLEEQVDAIDAELVELAHYSLRSGTGAIGYRSRHYDHATRRAWVGIELGKEVSIDELVLVPAVWRDTEKGFLSDGFPEAFRVLAGTAGQRRGTVIAEVTASDFTLPRVAPLVVPTPGVRASWVRVETTRMSPRAFDGNYVFQLSELLVFSGEENVALHKPVTTSANKLETAFGWDVQFLTDGFLPYLMNSAQGRQSTAYLSPVDVGRRPSLTLDLRETYPLSRIHIHSVDQGDTVPQSAPDSIGLPQHILIEGAEWFNFSDSRELLEFRPKTVYDTAPIMMWNVPETPCRYVRVTALRPYIYDKGYVRGSRLGFAEIELFANGQNVALGKPVITSYEKIDIGRPVSKVTDGRNLYGMVLPIREWLHQLARRHDLETMRPLVAKELNERYTRQNVNFRRMIWLAVLLAAGIAFTFLIGRLLRMRQVAHLKQRFAADLHDELGANLHTIGLLSDLAEGAKESPEELSMIHQRIRAVTERTGTAVRNWTNMLEVGGLYTGLVSDMRRASTRIMANLEHDFVIEGEEHLAHLKPRTRVDLFLFYKECLINISRHSGATRFRTHLAADPREVRLSIHDNGSGISEGVPTSLKRRARLLGARVSVERPEKGGTTIQLVLRLRRSQLSRTAT